MRGYVLSPRAQSDIDEIWDYTAENWGDDQAEIYTNDIRRIIEIIAQDNRKGQACDHIRAGYRKASVGAHMIFFRPSASGGTEIVRILHQSMDFGRHL